MNNYSWKHQYFEKNSKELHTNIFRSLEIAQYLKKTLENHGLYLHDYKINFVNSKINIFLCICKSKQINTKTKFNNKKSEKIHKEIFKKVQKKIVSQNNYVTKNLQTLNICKTYRHKIQNEGFQTLKINDLSNKILKSLKLFTKNKQDICLTIKEINFVNSNEKTKQILKTLFKFQKTPFFNEGKTLLAPITTYNSAQLLGNFISTQLRSVKKQHNFFFNFLKESLKIMISQKFSKIKGTKIIIKGRINNAARSQTRVINLGKISLIAQNSNINYSESTAFTSNGTIGVKVWVSEKKY